MKRNGAIKCIYDTSLFYVHWKKHFADVHGGTK